MSVAALADTIVAAAKTAMPELKRSVTEDTIGSGLPAIVIGWPTSLTSEHAFYPGRNREVSLAVAIYVAAGTDPNKAYERLESVIDGPLLATINDALAPNGVVTSVEQVTAVTINDATPALRVPITIDATI